MKSVGERIRQARVFRKMSGEKLARAVGYKTQSGIGNLENRPNGTGGDKIVLIARELNFSLQWFLAGPDTDDMSKVPPFEDGKVPPMPDAPLAIGEQQAIYRTDREHAHCLIDAMSSEGIGVVLDVLRVTAKQYPRQQDQRAGLPVPAPPSRAA